MITDQEFDIARKMARHHHNINNRCYRLRFSAAASLGSLVIGIDSMYLNNNSAAYAAYAVAALSLLYSGVQALSAHNSKKAKEQLNDQLQRLRSESIDGILDDKT